AAWPVVALDRLLVNAIDGGPRVLSHAGITDLLHDADDRVPVAIRTELAELEPLAERRAPRVVAIRKGLIDDGHRRIRVSIGCVEKPAFSQMRSDGFKIVTGYHARQRHLLGDAAPGLSVEQVKRCLISDS